MGVKSHKLWGGRFGAGPTPEFDALNNSISVDFRDPSTPNSANSCSTPITMGCIADVQVNYIFGASTPLIGQLVGNIPMMGETKFTIEALCVEPTQSVCPPGS